MMVSSATGIVLGTVLNAIVGIPAAFIVMFGYGLGANADGRFWSGFCLCVGIAVSSLAIGWLAGSVAGNDNVMHGAWSTLLLVVLVNLTALAGGVPLVVWFAFSVIAPLFGSLGDQCAWRMRRQSDTST